jgi:hypothetical protein
LLQLIRALLVAPIILAPEIAGAQDGAYGRVSFSFMQGYESNLFAAAAAGDVQDDVVFRVGPTIEAGYLSAPLTLTTRYGFDAERYADHSAPSSSFARQDAAVELRQSGSGRFAFETRAAYLATRSPQELNLETALATDRVRATRVSAAPTVRYQLTRTTRLSLGYGFTRDALAGRGATTAHDLWAGVERQAGRLTGRRIDYRFQQFDFGHGDAESVHVITAGWSRTFTRRTDVEMMLGPRLTSGSVRPELTTLVRWRLQKTNVSGGYARTQATTIGERGLIDVQRVAVTAEYRAGRHIRLSATPAFIESVHDRARVSVSVLDLAAIGETTRGLSVVLSGRFGVQQGRMRLHEQGTLIDRREQIPTRSVSLRLVTTFPRSTRTARH